MAFNIQTFLLCYIFTHIIKGSFICITIAIVQANPYRRVTDNLNLNRPQFIDLLCIYAPVGLDELIVIEALLVASGTIYLLSHLLK